MSKVQASVLPAGAAAEASLESGLYDLVVKAVVIDGGCQMNLVEYPDGFTKWHQAIKPTEIAPQLTNQIQGRFGANSSIKALPKSFIEGAIITVEVNNGIKS